MKVRHIPPRLVVLMMCLVMTAEYSYAQATAAETPELIRLRSQYRDKITAVTAPIRSAYLSDLKSLYDQKTRIGQLDAALAVREEMEQVSSYEFIPADRLNILSATYGAGKKQIDATQKVTAMIQGDHLTITPVNSLLGDPAPGTPKVLEIKYTFKGRTRTKKIPEKTTVTIP